MPKPNFIEKFNEWDSEINEDLENRDYGLIVLVIPLGVDRPQIEYVSTMTRPDAALIVQMMFPELTIDFGPRTLQ